MNTHDQSLTGTTICQPTTAATTTTATAVAASATACWGLIIDAILQSTFIIGENYLRSRTSFLFSDMSQKGVRQRAAWSIGTWSKKVKPSSVDKFGTDSDKDLLMQETERRGRGTQRYRTYFQRNCRSLLQNIVQDSDVSARITVDL